MLRSIVFLCLLVWSQWLFATTSSSSAAVLNYYPRCDYKVLASSSQQMEQKLLNIKQGEPLQEESAMLMKELIQQLQAEADSVGADALILNSVKQRRVNTVGGSPVADRNSRTARVTLRAKISAELIQLCEDDSALPKEHTPFNARGARNLRGLSLSLNLSPPENLSSPADASSEISVGSLRSDILGLKQGFYGIKLGSSLETLLALLGPAAVELQLENNAKALAYGRYHWFYFINDQLVRMEIDNRHLSASAAALIPVDPFFDDLQRWRLDGQFGYRSRLDALQKYYGESLQPLAADLFVLSQQQHQLELHFESYLKIADNIASGLSDVQLNKVVLRDSQLDPEVYKLSFMPEAQLLEILQLFSLELPLSETMSHVLAQVDSLHRLQLERAETLYMLHPNFALQFDGINPKVLFFQPLLVESAQTQSLVPLLQAAGLPSTLQGFRQRYQDGILAFDRDIYYINDYDLLLSYDDDDDILSLRIRSY